jgi:hypothetical protein
MASPDSDLVQLDTLTDVEYLKFIKKFYDNVRIHDGLCESYRMDIIIDRMHRTLHFPILIWTNDSESSRNYLRDYVRSIPMLFIYVYKRYAY